MSEVTINEEQRLYVIPCGNGYTCLGFDYAYRQAQAVATWANLPGPSPVNIGTPDGYRDYTRIMSAGAEHARITGRKCVAEIIPELDAWRGHRVEVTYPDGARTRFYVGRSTGWLPCTLEIKTRRSLGGSAAYFPPGSTVRVLHNSPRL